MTTARARVAFMVGSPVAHTTLPGAVAMWAVSRDANVLLAPLDLGPAALPAFLGALREAGNCDGVVLTAPLKQAALALSDRASDAATLAGAVNVIRRTDTGALHGDNTDGTGMRHALRDVGFDPLGARILIFGCGGAGSAIAGALRGGCVDVTDISRARAGALAARVGATVVAPPRDVARYDLVVNATAMGTGDTAPVHDLAGLRPETVVADVIAGDTAFLHRARSIGCRTVCGRAMAAAQLPFVLAAFGWRDA